MFTLPPLDGSLTIPQIYDWQYQNNPDHPAFVFENDEGVLRNLVYSELVPAIHRAGQYIASSVGIDVHANQNTYPIVALLSTADTITTYTTLIGMLRLGVVAFPISPRFSAAVIAHLLEITGASYVFVSVERRLHDLAQDAVAVAASSSSFRAVPTVCAMPKFEDLYTTQDPFKSLPEKVYDLSSTALIVHSSCSTSEFPKAIHWTVRFGIQQALFPGHGAENLTGHVIGCHSLEPFHGIGLLFLFYMPACGLVMNTFRPTSPAILPTPEATFRAYTQTKPTYTLTPTRFLEEWASDPHKVRFLSTLKGVLSGGKMIRTVVGDYLAKEGVCLRNMYGSTESGHISAVPSASHGTDWQFFQVSPQITTRFVPMGDGSFEAVTVSTSIYAPPIINCRLDGRDAYRSGDLFVPHPQKKGLWKFVGRKDSRIMSSSGHVVDPSETEDKLTGHPQIAGAVVFGQGRSRLGVVLELKPEFAFDPDDSNMLSEFRDAIWCSFQEINASAPKYRHIAKEMIIVATPDKPFEYSLKGAPKRPLILIQYQPEIDALYGSPANDVLYQHATICARM